MVVWDMALFSLVDSYQHCGETWYLHLLERRGSFAGKKMEGVDKCTGGHEKWLLLLTGIFTK